MGRGRSRISRVKGAHAALAGHAKTHDDPLGARQAIHGAPYGSPDAKPHHMGAKAAFAIVVAISLTVMAAMPLLLPESKGKAHAVTAKSQSLAIGICAISQYTDGSYVHDFDQGILGVNGEVAFCMDPAIDFRSGDVQSADILSRISRDQLDDIAMRAYYARSVYSDAYVSDDARIILAQTLIWEVISPNESYILVPAENGGSFSEVTAAVRDDVCAKAREFSSSNKGRYECSGTLWINGAVQPVATFSCELVVGTIDLVKRSGNASISDGNPSYSLKDAVYGIFADAACASQVTSMVADTNGYAKSAEIRVGSYFVKETKAPIGFMRDENVYSVSVQAGQTSRVNGREVTDPPIFRDGLATLVKHDAETAWSSALNEALGGATLKQARYTVEHYVGIHSTADAARASGSPRRSWMFETDVNGFIDFTEPDAYLVSGELYRDLSGKAIFPLGTYLIFETSPSEGYLLSDATYLVSVAQEGQSTKMEGDIERRGADDFIMDAEQVKRSDLALIKAREDDMERLSCVPFRLTSKTTGEAHILVTDDNGRIDTSANWNLHSHRTNANDNAVDENGNVDASKLDAGAGVWYGLRRDGTMAPVDDGLGALPYDIYSLEELRCPANAGLMLVSIENVAIKRDGVLIELGTVDNRTDDIRYVTTFAKDARDGDKELYADGHAIITDDIELTNLAPGKEYVVYGTVVSSDTGLPVLARRDADGECTEEDTSVQGESQDDVGGHEAIELKESVEKPVTQDEIREFWNGLLDLIGAYRIGSESAHSFGVLTDIKLDMDAIRAHLKDNSRIYSKMVMASKEVSADSPSSFTTLDYEMDANGMEGDYVIFDLLLSDDKVVAAHADTGNDMESFVVVRPSIETKATDYADGDHEILPSFDTCVMDIVRYENLIEGEEYVLNGLVVNKEDGAILQSDGMPVEAETRFTAEGASGITSVEFCFDSSKTPVGAELVVFEYLSKGGEIVAEHADLSSEAQTISVGSLPSGKGYFKMGGESGIDANAMIALGASMSALLFGSRRAIATKLRRA